jgi:hypothetical protein
MTKMRLGLISAVAALAAGSSAGVPVAAASSAASQAQAVALSSFAWGTLGGSRASGSHGDGPGDQAGRTPPHDHSKARQDNPGGQGYGGPNVQNGNAGRDSSGALRTSFDGITFLDQGLASGHSIEPPDQGLCVGNGFVLESVNLAVRVFRADGRPVGPAADLNTFYGYRHAGDPPVNPPIMTDPSCLFDRATQRWFHVVITSDFDPAIGDFTGANHLDLAVSRTPDPNGAWTIYKIPVQADGGCGSGSCFGDYPHIGADANGFYISTNAYDFFDGSFHGAQIYAFSKAQLAAGVAQPAVQHFDTSGLVGGNAGFTVWPAQPGGGQQDAGNQGGNNQNGNSGSGNASRSKNEGGGGVEYFLSSNATPEAGGSGASNQLVVWSLTNTASLNSSSPSLQLRNAIVPVKPYTVPPFADQRAGSAPLAECLNDAACFDKLAAYSPVPSGTEQIGQLDTLDSRMQQVSYADGRLWGALGTGVNGGAQAGVEYFVVTPNPDPSKSKVDANGYVSVAGNNVSYPAIGVSQSGTAVMALTVVGPDYYPSAGYVVLDRNGKPGPVRIAAAGLGPQDGFSEYNAFSFGGLFPRWGDYAAAAVDGNTVWIASEYIGQTCTLAAFEAAPFGRCGGTRGVLGNWYTRISAIQP